MEGGKAVFPASTGLWEGGEAVFPVSPGPPETGNAVFPPSGGSRGAGKRAFPPSSDSREAGKTMFPPSSETPETGNATLPLSNPPSQTGKTALPLSGKREETGKTAFPPSKVRPESENEPPEGGKAAFPPSNPAHFSKPLAPLGAGTAPGTPRRSRGCPRPASPAPAPRILGHGFLLWRESKPGRSPPLADENPFRRMNQACSAQDKLGKLVSPRASFRRDDASLPRRTQACVVSVQARPAPAKLAASRSRLLSERRKPAPGRANSSLEDSGLPRSNAA